MSRRFVLVLVLGYEWACRRRPPPYPPAGLYALCIDPNAMPPRAAPLPPCRATDAHYGFRIGATGSFDLIPEPLGCSIAFAAGGIELRCPRGATLRASWVANADGSVTTDLIDRLDGDADPGPSTLRRLSVR